MFQLRVLLEVLPPQSGYGMASVPCVHIFHDQECVFGEGWGKKSVFGESPEGNWNWSPGVEGSQA